MILLVVYDRAVGKTLKMSEYSDDAFEAGEGDRLAEELALAQRDPMLEIVTLQAASLATLRLTHGRSFDSLEELAERGVRAVMRLG